MAVADLVALADSHLYIIKTIRQRSCSLRESSSATRALFPLSSESTVQPFPTTHAETLNNGLCNVFVNLS